MLAPQKFHSGVACNVCFRIGGPDCGNGISCPICNIDICEGCSNQLKYGQNRHCHKLYLNRRQFIWNLCRRKFKGDQGTFRYYQQCNYDECMEYSITI